MTQNYVRNKAYFRPEFPDPVLNSISRSLHIASHIPVIYICGFVTTYSVLSLDLFCQILFSTARFVYSKYPLQFSEIRFPVREHFPL